jgi:hypothetical protein
MAVPWTVLACTAACLAAADAFQPLSTRPIRSFPKSRITNHKRMIYPNYPALGSLGLSMHFVKSSTDEEDKLDVADIPAFKPEISLESLQALDIR